MQIKIINTKGEIVNLMKRTLIILLIICVILAIFSIFNIPNKILKQIYKKEYSQYVEKYSKQYNVDEELVYAVIKEIGRASCRERV